jgi:predicted PurR-regulated permease PerM
VVGLTFVAIIIVLVIQFRTIIGPLILSFILAYLLHPLIGRMTQATRLSWRMAVNLIYLVLIVLLAGGLTLSGLAIIQQLQNLVQIVQTFVTELPQIVEDLSSQVFVFGPFQFNLSQLNLEALTEQLLGTVRPLVERVGGLLTTFATSAAATLGWTLFVILISYFLLADAGRVSDEIVRVEVPGYNADIRRLSAELRLIWDAFLRGQLIIMALVLISYTLLMWILGVRFAFGIAILAGLARFVPYLGPLVTWIVLALVAFLQETNHFGMEPFSYVILVVVAALVLDQIFDNMVTPRFLGSTLGVHPAGVLVAAIIATNLIGVIGLLLAAPVLATLKLLGRYVVRKMFDMDPWPEPVFVVNQSSTEGSERWLRRMRALKRAIQRRLSQGQ